MNKAKEIAGNYYRGAYECGKCNCAEAIVKTFNETLELGLSDDALKMASGFGGGLGHSGCMCGALSGAVMVLNCLAGRAHGERPLSDIYPLTAAFHDVFKEHFGATCCRVLNGNPFGSKEQGKNCLKLIGETAELLDGFIVEKQLTR